MRDFDGKFALGTGAGFRQATSRRMWCCGISPPHRKRRPSRSSIRACRSGTRRQIALPVPRRAPSPPPPPAPDPPKLTRQTPLATSVIQGYGTHDISLGSVVGELPERIPYGSIRIQFRGKPGSIVAEIASVERNKGLVVDARFETKVTAGQARNARTARPGAWSSLPSKASRLGLAFHFSNASWTRASSRSALLSCFS